MFKLTESTNLVFRIVGELFLFKSFYCTFFGSILLILFLNSPFSPIIEKKYQLASYYYENYLVDKIDLVVETYENGILFLEEVPDKDQNLKLDYLVLYAKILNEKNNFKKELSIRKEIVDLEAKYNGKKHEYYYDAKSTKHSG